MQPLAALRCFGLLGAAALELCAPTASAQAAPQGRSQPYALSSGLLANPSPRSSIVFRHLLQFPGETPWMRVHFGRCHLEKGSAVRLTALQDGDVQTLNQVQLEQWRYGSAFFNGAQVLVELVAGAHTQKNELVLESAWLGLVPGSPSLPETICGDTDDRVPTAMTMAGVDARIGRLLSSALGGGCTGWIIEEPMGSTDKCHLSAGHCFPMHSVLQFNVPSSLASGAIQHPPASDQYAVDVANLSFTANGLGDDWAVFKCFPNPLTGLTTFEAQGAAFALGAGAPMEPLHVTGYGTDGSAGMNAMLGNANCSATPLPGYAGFWNQIQQVCDGFVSAIVGDVVDYAIADTCGGNSGSPVVSYLTGAAFAIHTNGGCSLVIGSTNSGTSVMNAGLQAAIATVCPTRGMPNDECPAALPVGDGVNGVYTNRGATTSLAWPCGSGATDVWFSYVASCTGVLEVNTCSPSTDYDTVLELFGGTCAASTALGCNDDSCALQSRLAVPVVAGAPYLLRVGGYSGAVGNFELLITCRPMLPNDECAGALPVAIGVNGPYSNIGATTSFAWPCGSGGNDVWFSYRADCSAILIAETCSLATDYDTTLQAFAGTCAALAPLACNDDACSLQSRITFTVSAGGTYLLRVGGYVGRTGRFELRLQRSGGAGGFATLPTGCGPTLSASGAPVIGGTLTFSLSTSTGSPLLWLGTPRAPIIAFCPPSACALGASFDVILNARSFTATVPCDGSLIGATLAVQGAEVGGSRGCALGTIRVATSDTQVIAIG